jgi:hypothetical protein
LRRTIGSRKLRIDERYGMERNKIFKVKDRIMKWKKIKWSGIKDWKFESRRNGRIKDH